MAASDDQFSVVLAQTVEYRTTLNRQQVLDLLKTYAANDAARRVVDIVTNHGLAAELRHELQRSGPLAQDVWAVLEPHSNVQSETYDVDVIR